MLRSIHVHASACNTSQALIKMTGKLYFCNFNAKCNLQRYMYMYIHVHVCVYMYSMCVPYLPD